MSFGLRMICWFFATVRTASPQSARVLRVRRARLGSREEPGLASGLAFLGFLLATFAVFYLASDALYYCDPFRFTQGPSLGRGSGAARAPGSGKGLDSIALGGWTLSLGRESQAD